MSRPFDRELAQRVVEQLAADGFVHHVQPLRRLLAQHLLDVFRAVENRPVAAERAQQLRLLLRAARAEDAAAGPLRELHGVLPRPARRRRHEHRFAVLDFAHLLQRDRRREAAHQNRQRLGRGLGHRDRELRRDGGVRPEAAAEHRVRHGVAHLQPLHAFAYRLHDARGLEAEIERRLGARVVAAGCHVHVARVDARHVVTNPHLARTGRLHLFLDKLGGLAEVGREVGGDELLERGHKAKGLRRTASGEGVMCRSPLLFRSRAVQ